MRSLIWSCECDLVRWHCECVPHRQMTFSISIPRYTLGIKCGIFSMAVTLINRLIGDDMFPHFWLKTALSDTKCELDWKRRHKLMTRETLKRSDTVNRLSMSSCKSNKRADFQQISNDLTQKKKLFFFDILKLVLTLHQKQVYAYLSHFCFCGKRNAHHCTALSVWNNWLES